MTAGVGLPSDEEDASLDEAVEMLRKTLPEASAACTLVIAGSGLGGFVKTVKVHATVEYADIPGVGNSTVAGHSGRLLLAETGEPSVPILVMSGRRHLYEGLSAADAARLPRAIFAAFPGIRFVIISNAAGGLNPAFNVGDLMVITDHFNWMFRNPLIGKNNDYWGPRFPDMSRVYNAELRRLVSEVAAENTILLRQGIYLAMHGPSYETRAEVQMLRHTAGADAVGMSTVPEAIIAAHMGRQVLGISLISNSLATPAVTSHEEVMEAAIKAEDRFGRLLSGVIPKMHGLS